MNKQIKNKDGIIDICREEIYYNLSYLFFKKMWKNL